MTVSAPDHHRSTPTGLTRRTLVKGAAWSVPVVAAAVATPLAAASAALAALTYEVAPIADHEAPFGASSLRVSNTGASDYTGPITLTTPAWTNVAPFEVNGAVRTTSDGSDIWTVPAASIPAGQSMDIPLTWAGPYPLATEQQPLTVSVDPLAASASPSGSAIIASPYQLLWFAVTPGGQGDPAGTPSFFIGNTTDTALDTTGEVRIGVWAFPQPSVRPIISGGTTYSGVRLAENGMFVGRYADVDLSASARAGRQVFSFAWGTPGGTQPVPQQSRQVLSITAVSGETFALLGSGTVYSSYRP